MEGRLRIRKGDAAIGPELEVVLVKDVLKLPEAMHHQRLSGRSWED